LKRSAQLPSGAQNCFVDTSESDPNRTAVARVIGNRIDRRGSLVRLESPVQLGAVRLVNLWASSGGFGIASALADCRYSSAHQRVPLLSLAYLTASLVAYRRPFFPLRAGAFVGPTLRRLTWIFLRRRFNRRFATDEDFRSRNGRDFGAINFSFVAGTDGNGWGSWSGRTARVPVQILKMPVASVYGPLNQRLSQESFMHPPNRINATSCRTFRLPLTQGSNDQAATNLQRHPEDRTEPRTVGSHSMRRCERE
jgi:hypothetical protein